MKPARKDRAKNLCNAYADATAKKSAREDKKRGRATWPRSYFSQIQEWPFSSLPSTVTHCCFPFRPDHREQEHSRGRGFCEWLRSLHNAFSQTRLNQLRPLPENGAAICTSSQNTGGLLSMALKRSTIGCCRSGCIHLDHRSVK